MSVDNRILTFIIASAVIGIIVGVIPGIYLYDTPPDTLKGLDGFSEFTEKKELVAEYSERYEGMIVYL